MPELKIRSRVAVARFVERQLGYNIFKRFEKSHTSREKSGKHHYGKQELRDLLDYIYKEEPQTRNQQLDPSNKCQEKLK